MNAFAARPPLEVKTLLSIYRENCSSRVTITTILPFVRYKLSVITGEIFGEKVTNVKGSVGEI